MKKLIVALIISLLPTIVVAGQAKQCALNSTCSFTVHGKFNKTFITSGLQPGQKYVCNIVRGKGRLLLVKNVYVSKDVTYNLKGGRLNKPLFIDGPKKGTGSIRYTLYNDNDPWHVDSFQFKCVPSA